MPTRIDAELGLDAKKFIAGMNAATGALEAFKSKADFAGSSIAISIRRASEQAGKSAREIKTEISDSAAEVAEYLKRSGAESKNWSQGITQEMRKASQAIATTADRVATSVDRASKSLQRGFGKGVIHPSLYTDLRLLDRNLQEVSLEATRTGNTIQNAVERKGVKAFNGGTSAAISFAQVIQDAPYGIRGVANNITQLTTQLGYMATSAKAAGISLKSALIGSLTNPATLAILAVSALTTGMQLFAMSSKKAAEETESLANALDKSRASVAAEVAELRTLVSIARDAGQGRKAQQEAINRLNKEYDIFNGTLNLNNIGSEENTRLINQQTEALIRQAQIKGVLDKITELTTKQLEIENSGIKENLKWYQFLWSSIRTGGNVLTAVEGLSEKAIQNRNKALEEGQQRIEDYIALLGQLTSIDLNYSGGNGGGMAAAIREQIAPINSELSSIGKLPEIATNIQTSIVNGVKGSMGVVRDQGVSLANAFNTGFAEILEYGIEDGISSMASAIGEALVHGGNIVQAGGGALLGALGGILVEVGKMTIGLGVTILAAKKALQTLNPFIAIGAGAALVAAGSAFAAQARDISQTIGGNTAGSSGPSGNGGSISISPANTGGIQGTVVFEISGRSLVGVLKREAIHGNRITP